MNRYLSAVLAATLIAGLTACGGGAQVAPSTITASAATAAASAAPVRTARAVPDVAGKTFTEARKALSAEGFVASIAGKNGTSWTGGVDDTVTAVSTVPAAGTVTVATAVTVTVNLTQDEYLTAAAKPKPTGLAATLPSKFPGYPLIVHGSKLDYRVASWFEGKLVDDQVVALIPGVYTPYNPHVKDLLAYYELGGDGDSIMRKQYMPETGGAGWPGVLPGPEEPK
ncbi:PASTA domain-containing protein [Arthrobacter sp. NPDC058130]|uniref:PASTA domain-containing protein n=1 Tax=Arthrobacter sp. NPDC058130 TaxID=3346353 RepID=UPI0036F04150